MRTATLPPAAEVIVVRIADQRGKLGRSARQIREVLKLRPFLAAARVRVIHRAS
jgi:hypothetical protein